MIAPVLLIMVSTYPVWICRTSRSQAMKHDNYPLISSAGRCLREVRLPASRGGLRSPCRVTSNVRRVGQAHYTISPPAAGRRFSGLRPTVSVHPLGQVSPQEYSAASYCSCQKCRKGTLVICAAQLCNKLCHQLETYEAEITNIEASKDTFAQFR